MNNVSVVLATSKTDGASLAHAGKAASPVIAKTRPNVIRLRNGAFIVLPFMVLSNRTLCAWKIHLWCHAYNGVLFEPAENMPIRFHPD